MDKVGTVYISSSFHLKNYLLIPNFSHKLVTIDQLTKELNCHVLMSSEGCNVHDALD